MHEPKLVYLIRADHTPRDSILLSVGGLAGNTIESRIELPGHRAAASSDGETERSRPDYFVWLTG